jgi:hypothetical protein
MTIYDFLDAKDLDYAIYAEPVVHRTWPNDCTSVLDNTNPRFNNPVQCRVNILLMLLSMFTSNYSRCSKITSDTTPNPT